MTQVENDDQPLYHNGEIKEYRRLINAVKKRYTAIYFYKLRRNAILRPLYERELKDEFMLDSQFTNAKQRDIKNDYKRTFGRVHRAIKAMRIDNQS